jgi:integrase/recombinase XerD
MKNRFERYLRELSGRCTPGTVKRVRVTLGGFMQWLELQGVSEWYEVTGEHLRAWAAWKSAAILPQTMHGCKREVRSFLRWMYRRGYVLVNPWDEALVDKRPPYRMRRVPTVVQAERALDKAGENRLVGVRDRAILGLAYGCGLRRGELQRLNLSDIRDDWLRVRGKGECERVVPLGAATKKELLRYAATERSRAASFSPVHETALFLTWYGRRLGLDAFGCILRRGGLNKTTTLHGLRHACATHMLRNGASIAVLRKLLGHAKLSTTQIYADVDRSDLAKLLLVYHPRG